ncbi:MAG: anti-sigma factor [Chloroflexi bacterium]|nr:anti-sigma factor [Ktedonobacteraceae bacterium]MBV8821525.1 anti-sigma factor [Ktedonobacteraceae bacterium]MBV9019104.1 anti-sigma factor [Ktedonobacteraceae bacterium]MBV9709082.1 anti-sigma factor [Chloroflexota bacterium]
MTCDDFNELSGAYVLDAITEEERKAVEEHLAHCSSCVLVVKELHSIVDLLPLAVPQIDPSPELKHRVLASLQENADVSPQTTTPARLVELVKTRPVQQQLTPSRTFWSRWGTQLIAAVAVLLLALSSGLTAISSALQGPNHALQTPVVVLTDTIYGRAMAPEAQGQLLYIPEQNVTILVMHGLPQVHDKVYQGWLIKDQKPISIGLLTVHNNVATLGFHDKAQGFTAVAVSQEQGPSPSAKPSEVVAVGQLQS